MKKDPTAFRKRFAAWKGGKDISDIYNGGLPRYNTGNDNVTQVTKNGVNYNVHDSAIDASGLNVTTPDVNISGTDKRQPYQQMYQNPNLGSTIQYNNPNAIRNFTDVLPVVGDIGSVTDIANDYSAGNYGAAAAGAAAMAVPGMVQKAIPRTWLGKLGRWIGGLFRPSKYKNQIPITRTFNGIRQHIQVKDLSNPYIRDALQKRSRPGTYPFDTPYETPYIKVWNFLNSDLYRKRIKNTPEIRLIKLNNLLNTSFYPDAKYMITRDGSSPTGWSVYPGSLGMHQNAGRGHGRILAVYNVPENVRTHEIFHGANRPLSYDGQTITEELNKPYEMIPINGASMNLEELTARTMVGLLDMFEKGMNINKRRHIRKYLKQPSSMLPDDVKHLLDTFGYKLVKRAFRKFKSVAPIIGSSAAAGLYTYDDETEE